jgi:hypothetical protein
MYLFQLILEVSLFDFWINLWYYEGKINLSDEELETLKTKKLEEQSLTPKTQNKKFDLNRGYTQNNNQKKLNYVPDEILVKYKNTKINLETVSGRVTALNFTNSKCLVKKKS